MSLAIPCTRVDLESNLQLTTDLPSTTETASSQSRGDDVLKIARASLSACPYREVQKISCLLNNGVMILRGQVSTYYMKQVAQTVLMNIPGVRHIVNAVQVCQFNPAPKDGQA